MPCCVVDWPRVREVGNLGNLGDPGCIWPHGGVRISDRFGIHSDNAEATALMPTRRVEYSDRSVAAQPVNDDCSSAIAITDGVTGFDTTTATTGPLSPPVAHDPCAGRFVLAGGI